MPFDESFVTVETKVRAVFGSMRRWWRHTLLCKMAAFHEPTCLANLYNLNYINRLSANSLQKLTFNAMPKSHKVSNFQCHRNCPKSLLPTTSNLLLLNNFQIIVCRSNSSYSLQRRQEKTSTSIITV